MAAANANPALEKNQPAKDTHAVMVKVPMSHYPALKAIAEIEDRDVGAQAVNFLKPQIDQYLAKKPDLAEIIASQEK